MCCTHRFEQKQESYAGDYIHQSAYGQLIIQYLALMTNNTSFFMINFGYYRELIFLGYRASLFPWSTLQKPETSLISWINIFPFFKRSGNVILFYHWTQQLWVTNSSVKYYSCQAILKCLVWHYITKDYRKSINTDIYMSCLKNSVIRSTCVLNLAYTRRPESFCPTGNMYSRDCTISQKVRLMDMPNCYKG